LGEDDHSPAASKGSAGRLWICQSGKLDVWRLTKYLLGMVIVFDSLTRLTIKGPQKMKWIVTHQTVKSEDYA